MIIKFPNQKITDEVFTVVNTKYWESTIMYILNSSYRKSVSLKPWIKEQVLNSSMEVQLMCDEIADNTDYDIQIIDILQYVRSNFTYISDTTNWKMNEYWQTADESVKSLKGDCEDGAILIYVLARLKGIPANRLLILCGDVKGGGHCWLGYKPNGYPIDFTFIDWCYWYKNQEILYRNKFHIQGTKIYEHTYDNEMVALQNSDYYNIWFAFNEDINYLRLDYRLTE